MSKTCSFIIYFNSERIGNLNQTLRFLAKREADIVSRAELVLVCQDKCDEQEIKSFFKKTIIKNLNLNYYNKPLMNNIGVNLSSNEILVLLDSDRILPKNYFKKNINLIQKNQIITTTNLEKLLKCHTDDEIDNLKYKSRKDFKSVNNEPFLKNAFSGNTIIYKTDYLESGGMDESFFGYGFADNDFVKTMQSLNKNFIFLEDLELHLYHSYDNNKRRKIENAKNAIKYILKWNLETNNYIEKKCKELNFFLDILYNKNYNFNKFYELKFINDEKILKKICLINLNFKEFI